MTNLAEAMGRVMMAAVTLPRFTHVDTSIERYVQTEFKKDDQAYVLMCMNTGRRVDVRNITT